MGRRTAYLHIGLPRSGAAFLDSALADHAAELEARGLRCPATSAEQLFRAAIEIRRDHRAWGYDRREVEGTWAEICRRAKKGKSDVVISQQLLAACTPPQIALLLDTLASFDVELVVTTREPDTEGLGAVLQRWTEAVGGPEHVHVIAAATDSHDPRREIWAALGELAGFDTTELGLAARSAQPVR